MIKLPDYEAMSLPELADELNQTLSTVKNCKYPSRTRGQTRTLTNTEVAEILRERTSVHKPLEAFSTHLAKEYHGVRLIPNYT